MPSDCQDDARFGLHAKSVDNPIRQSTTAEMGLTPEPQISEVFLTEMYFLHSCNFPEQITAQQSLGNQQQFSQSTSTILQLHYRSFPNQCAIETQSHQPLGISLPIRWCCFPSTVGSTSLLDGSHCLHPLKQNNPPAGAQITTAVGHTNGLPLQFPFPAAGGEDPQPLMPKYTFSRGC